jgi:hypothetical protein
MTGTGTVLEREPLSMHSMTVDASLAVRPSVIMTLSLSLMTLSNGRCLAIRPEGTDLEGAA